MTHQQLERLQEYMERLDKQIAEVLALKEALDKFNEVKEDEELLVPIAAGVFIKAKASKEKSLQVNVGQGIVVPKSVAEMQLVLDTQLSEMKEYEAQLHRQFDENLAKLQTMQKEFE